MGKSIEQKAVDFAGNRKLGSEHGFPSFTANCLEKGYVEGYKTAEKELKTEQTFTKEDMIEASKYGYNFHKTTQFPQQEFEDSCIRNTQQWLTTFKK